MKKETAIARISKKISFIIFLLIFTNMLVAQTNSLVVPPICPPSSDAGPDKYICPVGGSIQIGTAPTSGVTYKWTPTTGLSDPNISNPIASPTTTTTYTLSSSGTNLITNGDFESGNVVFTSDYIYYSGTMNPGTIVVGSNAITYNSQWCDHSNHTPSGSNMLIVKGDLDASGYFWKETISVTPNTIYNLSFYGMSLNQHILNETGPLIEVTINGQTTNNSPHPLYGAVCVWANLSDNFNSGNNNTIEIKMRTLTGPTVGSPTYGVGQNDFAIDDISLKCYVASDDVTVTVCNPVCPIITPSGPIDYYIPVDDGAPIGRILTSSIARGNQWYYNNTAIAGAISQTYKVGSGWSSIGTGDYYVMNNGCASNTVHVEFKQYGYGNYGEDVFDRLGAKIHPVQTSNYYCYNTNNNFIQQFNLGPTATYTWDFRVYPIGGTQNISITPGSDNPNSNQAQVNIGGATLSTYTYVQGVADLNGSEIILDYYLTLSHPDFIPTNQQVCANAGQSIINLDGSSISTLPGGSGFDWESYNFGSNGLIVSGPGAGSNSVTIPGRSTPQQMVVKFTGPSVVQKNFYYNWGGCYKENYNVTLINGCLHDKAMESVTKVNIYPNPASSQITISSDDAITNIEISDVMNPIIKRLKVNGSHSAQLNVGDLRPGIYTCKITTDKGIDYKKLVIKR